MSFMSSLDITGSALSAEQHRMSIIAQNIANSGTTRTEDGDGPYIRKQAVFQEVNLNFSDVLYGQLNNKDAGGGVIISEIVESDNPLEPVYDPSHPDADDEGYVWYPNVNRTEEMADMMAATRAYEANITALNVVKSLASKALEIGK